MIYTTHLLASLFQVSMSSLSMSGILRFSHFSKYVQAEG